MYYNSLKPSQPAVIWWGGPPGPHEEPDRGVRRGRGLPTFCQEVLSSEGNHFLDWGLRPQSPGI
jgi:hypothetical protein